MLYVSKVKAFVFLTEWISSVTGYFENARFLYLKIIKSLVDMIESFCFLQFEAEMNNNPFFFLQRIT